MLILASAGPALAGDAHGGHLYRSVDGTMVHVPYERTVKCADGRQSVSHHSQGTCSHHQGVAEWR
jgi:hypothetical protein